jgi:hypothetical protein
MYVSPTYKLAKKTIMITLKEMLDRSQIDYSFNRTDSIFHIKNWDGLIWIGSGDDPDSLRGPNLAWAGIDEPFIQSREVFDQMIARVRHPKAEKREIFLTGTPEQLNWGYELTNADIDIGIVVASTLDNPHLPQEYKDNLLAAYTEEQIDAYVHGKFVNLTQGRVCKTFSRDRHVGVRPDLDEMLKYGELFMGVDFNVDYMSGLVGVDVNGYVHFFDEFRMRNANTFELAEAARVKYPNLIHVYPDATGKARKTSSTKSDHQIMRDAGFVVHTKPANPPVKDRVNAWNRLLKDDRITIDPKCKYLIADNEMMVWKNGDLDQSGTNAERTHAFDAASYPVAYKYPIVKNTATSMRRPW